MSREDESTEAPGTVSMRTEATPAAHASTRARVIRGSIVALVSGVCFGLSGTASKCLMEAYAIDPLWLSSARQLGACVLFMIAALMTTPDKVRACARSPRLLGAIAAYGLCGILLSQIGYLEAIDMTNAATATVLENSSLLFLLLYTCVTHRRLPRGLETVSVVLALTGIYLLATGGDPTGFVVPVAGIAWGVAAGLATALISILPARSLEAIPSFVTNAFAMLMGGVVLTAFVRPWEHAPSLDLVGWLLLAFVVVIGTFGAYALYVRAAREAGPMRAALLAAVEPVVALVTSAAWLGQVFLPTDFVGFALIMATVFLTAR